jgi:hydrogenase-4 component F
MTVVVALIVLLPLLGALAVCAGAGARGAGLASVAGGSGSFAAAVVLAVRIEDLRHVEAWSGFLYVDSMGAFFALVVSFIVVLASLGSAAYLGAEAERRALSSFQVRLYFVFFSLFASGMLAVFMTGNLGLLWVLIETSTLASVVLVGLEGHSRSLEAAWKYVIISSFGVTIALVATVFLFFAASGAHLTSEQRLTWYYLLAHAHGLTPASMRLAFLLAVVGYGTKVGLAPMQTWLPDAHSEAPSPASAMLSAALLNTGMYAIIRFRAVAIPALGSHYPNTVLLFFGFLSVFIGVMFLVGAANYKRMFAYSSVEHMGIIAIALGFGGTLGLYGALLQVLAHAIGKAVLFLSSGHLVLGYRTREVSQVRGALTVLPFAAGALLLASLGVAGSPPFGVFLSELTIIRAGFAAANPFLPALLLVLLVIGFISLLNGTIGMVSGERPSAEVLQPYQSRSLRLLASAPLVVGLGALVVLGLWIPGGLNDLLMHSIRAVS